MDKQTAHDLARWTLDTLANRCDAYGAHKRDGGKYTSKDALTLARLEQHYRAEQPRHVVGLHAAGTDNLSRWACFDVDAHDRPREDAEKVARDLYEQLRNAGAEPILEDSAGGFHIWTVFAEPVATARAFSWARSLCPPGAEAFPKQRRIEPGRFGSWLRLPGLHPRRGVWSTLWDPASGEWVSLEDGADALLIDAPRCPVDLLPDVPDILQDSGKGARAEGTEPLALGLPLDVRRARALSALWRLPDADRDNYERTGADGAKRGWVFVGMALHRIDASDFMLEQWRAWSRLSPKFEPGCCAAKWRAFDGAPEGYGLSALERWAGADNLSPSIQVDAGAPAADREAGPHGLDVVITEVRRGGKFVKLGLRVTKDGEFLADIDTSTSDSGLTTTCRRVASLAGMRQPGQWDEIYAWLKKHRLRSDLIDGAQKRLSENTGKRAPEDVLAESFIKSYGIRFQTPRGTWWLESGRRAREEWPAHLLGTCPPPCLDALIASGHAGDRDEAHSAFKRLKDVTAHVVRERVPDELDADLGPESLAARAFRDMLRRRLLQASEWWPRDSHTSPQGKCGPLHHLVQLADALKDDGTDEVESRRVADKLGRWHRSEDGAAPTWLRVDVEQDADGTPRGVVRIGISHLLLDAKESAAGRDGAALRALAKRYGVLETEPLDNRARSAPAGRGRRVRLAPLNPGFSEQLLAFTRATDTRRAMPADLDDSDPGEGAGDA